MTENKIQMPILCELSSNSLSDSDVNSATSNLSFSTTSNSTDSITSSSSFSTDSKSSPLGSPRKLENFKIESITFKQNLNTSQNESIFKTKKFYAKDWLFTKLNELVTKESKCIVLLGEYGTGKSHFIHEINNRSKILPYNVLAVHCFSLFSDNSLGNLYENIGQSVLEHFGEKLKPTVPNANLSDQFTKNVTNLIPKDDKPSVILIDGLDDLVVLDKLGLTQNSVEQVLDFLEKVFEHFPKWLSLVITSRRQTEKNFLRKKFQTCEKISIDRGLNLNKIISSSKSSHSLSQKTNSNRLSTPIDLGNLNNLRDLQIYILNRLNSDQRLKLKLNSKLDKSIELLNLLLIKSNNSILYINIIFNLILNNLFILQDLKLIESNLNSLYKYCLKLIEIRFKEIKDCRSFLKTLFGVVILGNNLDDLYSKLKIRFRNLNPTMYEQVYDLVDKLFDLENHVNLTSLYEFLFTDEAMLEESHFCLGFYYFNQKKLEKFKFHLKKCKNLIKDFDYFYSLICNDKKMVKNEKGGSEFKGYLFDLVTKGDLESIRSLKDCDGIINELTDSYDQTCLIVAVKLNHVKLVEYFFNLGKCNLDHCDSSGWTALRYSAWTGNEQIVNILLKYGATIDSVDKELRTALRAAVFSGHENIVRILIKNGADVNKTDLENRSILHVAAYMGHLNIVNILLQSGAFINHQDILGRSVLATSIYSIDPRNRFDLIKILIKNGAKIDQTDDNNQTPLILAGLENEIKIIDLLLSNNADIDHIDNLGHTLLTHAIKNMFTDQVDYLLKKNVATHILDPDGRSVLSIASSLGADQILGLLMQRGLDEMHRDNNGWTPLHETSYHGHLNTTQMLLNYGSEVDAIDNLGRTSLYLSCQQGHLMITRVLLDHKASFYIKTHEDESPFKVSLNERNFQISQLLIDRGYYIDEKDLEGKTTLHKFILETRDVCEQIKFLLDSNSSTNLKDSQGKTSLHLAVNSTVDLINLLTSYPVDLDIQDNDGNTPLLLSCLENRPSIAKILINKKCNLNIKNKNGDSSLIISIRNRNYELCEELLKNGCQINNEENPIKLANMLNYNEIVSLLQYYSALSFKPDVRKTDSLNVNFNNRCLITPNTFSSYMSNLNHRNRTFVLNLDDLEPEEEEGSSKSKMQVVKDKIFGQESPSLRVFLKSLRKDKDEEKPKSKSIVHYLWKKLKLSKDNKDDFQGKIQRSVTDTIASSLMYSKNDTLTSSFGTLTNMSSRQDESSYIFNRNSLSDCLNPHMYKQNSANTTFSYRQIHVKQYETNNRPNKLDLNYFKKETSI